MKIKNIVDQGGNSIKENPKDNSTFLVDNILPTISYFKIFSSDNSTSCTRSQNVHLEITGSDDGYIKKVYVDNSSSVSENNRKIFNSVDSRMFDNASINWVLNNCKEGNYFDNKTGEGWPEDFFGCAQSVNVWFED